MVSRVSTDAADSSASPSWSCHLRRRLSWGGDEVTRSGLLGTPDLVLFLHRNDGLEAICSLPPFAAQFGTFRSRSSSQAAALASDGARQSPRGDNAPPAETFGPFGIAERLNWLKAKNRRKNTSSQ